MAKTTERLSWDKIRETEPYQQYKKERLNNQNEKCHYCQQLLYEEFTWDGLIGWDEDGNEVCAPRTERYYNYAFDHVIPLALGGSNDFDNLVICCHPCNSRKHAKLNWTYTA